MWDLPRPGLEPVSPALAGRFSTTAPPGKPGTATFEYNLAVFYATKHTFITGFSNHTPWYLSKLVETYVHTKTSAWMFTAALFIIAKTWKLPRYPWVGKWMNKLLYIHTMEHFSALNGNDLKSQEKTWRKRMYIAKWKKSTWKNHILMIPTIWYSEKAKLCRQ